MFTTGNRLTISHKYGEVCLLSTGAYVSSSDIGITILREKYEIKTKVFIPWTSVYDVTEAE